jgi:hypothetical protein
VIGVRIDFRSVQFLAPGHAQPVGKLLHFRSHAA